MRIMAEGDLGALPVVSSGQVVGVLSEHECAHQMVATGRSPQDTRVDEIMTSDPISVHPEQTLDECMHLMINGALRHLPVVENGRATAILSLKEVVQALLSDKELIIDHALHAGRQKDAFIKNLKDLTFEKLVSFNRAQLHPLRSSLEQAYGRAGDPMRGALVAITREIEGMLDVLDRLSTWYFSEKTLESKRVLLAESDRKAQIITKMALGGTGVSLDIAMDMDTGRDCLAERTYDIICVNTEMIDLARLARRKNPAIDMVFLTSDDIKVYLPTLREYPYLSNIVSRGNNDRTFTVRSITTTISKLANRDIFGLEKYMNWGVDVHEELVVGSEDRYRLIEQMERDLTDLGLRRSLVTKCATVAEELLLNAIYDAPHDSQGKPRFAHDRTAKVRLAPSEQALFRYACDGMLVAISVEDPFGRIERDTILDYLEACYLGKPMPPNAIEAKGGAGQGIFMVMEIADLAVFNVRPGVRSEVISLFAVDLQTRKRITTSSFHYFRA